MTKFSSFAAVDLGSNSFNLQIARVVDEQIYPLDSIREPLAIAAGLDEKKFLDSAAQDRAIACLQRFGERLRGMEKKTVRAIGTNTLRVAKNSKLFLKKAENALGFPIDVISGREEARLIYLGVAHSIPKSQKNRLVIDIGGGSTELIIGNRFKPEALESLFMGCVSYTRNFFPNGILESSAFKNAYLAARFELQRISELFNSEHWGEAIGASGTLGAILRIASTLNNGEEVITPKLLETIRNQMLEKSHWKSLIFDGLRDDRKQYLAGGLAIAMATMKELKIDKMIVAKGAIREGILYDLMGRFRREDIRQVTVANYKKHYHIDIAQSKRVTSLTKIFSDGILTKGEDKEKNLIRILYWAAELHEIGFSIGYSGYHRHGSYILKNAEMPGFSTSEQNTLAAFVISHRRSLEKTFSSEAEDLDWRLLLSLRLAVLFYRKRRIFRKPKMSIRYRSQSAELSIEKNWLERNPLTLLALTEETSYWKKIGIGIRVKTIKSDKSLK